MKPSKGNLLCKVIEPESRTTSGVLLTTSSQKQPKTATILAVGNEVTDYEKGDKIVYKNYSVTEVTINDEDLIILDHEDVLGTITN